MNLKYPTSNEVIEINKRVLEEIKIKKADRSELKSYKNLNDSLISCKVMKGDIYDKGVCLIKNLVQKHPFVSGNRRTAFVVTERFIKQNNEKFDVENSGKQAKVLLGIRENYYKDQEIKEWLKGQKIRGFER